MIKLVYILITLLFLASCNDNDPGTDNGGASGEVTDVTHVTSQLTVDIQKDKACYTPGEPVNFTASQMPAGTKVRYRYLNSIVEEREINATTWSWTPPTTDYTGYLVELYQQESDDTEIITGVIAIDVSSDWSRFPRYGFVAAFEDDKTEEVIREEMAYLNRHHINGVQFQDWHNKHHWPLGGTRNHLDEWYYDIAMRPVYTEVVENYIHVQHELGMKSMFYNLCYGALNDAVADGVKEEWYIFQDKNHSQKDSHNLPSSWKSNIYVLDAANEEWLAYIAQRNDDVYFNFDFDGFHIDQLGYRGDRYDYQGNAINMPNTYTTFIKAMEQAHPDKRLVMNAVSSYGAQQIAGSGNVDFLYNEVWGDEPDYKNLRNIISANDIYSNGEKKTVFAAYMNYEIAEQKGEFNTPGILLTDAVIFALGGSHLELGGDHMLCKEYFPNNNLSMTRELQEAIVHYYDFLTGYQNLLRNGGDENNIEISCTNNRISLTTWSASQNPQLSKVNVVAKQVNGKQVIHLLNFTQADNVSWRDLYGTMPEPMKVSGAELEFNYTPPINKIWVATPDEHGGAPVELAFRQENGKVKVTLPSIKYWSMVVIE